MPEEVATPELNKMQSIKDQSQAIGEFLDWLSCTGIILARQQSYDLIPYQHTVTDLLAEYFEIDLEQVDRERKAILAEWSMKRKGGDTQ